MVHNPPQDIRYLFLHRQSWHVYKFTLPFFAYINNHKSFTKIVEDAFICTCNLFLRCVCLNGNTRAQQALVYYVSSTSSMTNHDKNVTKQKEALALLLSDPLENFQNW